MKNKKEIWFKAKTYGWGWHPCTWQGWLITLMFIVLATASSFIVKMQPILFLGYLGVLIAILMIICLLKGEKPRWQWGKKK